MRKRLDGRLRFVFRHLPLHEVHPDAQRAAEAAEAAAAQGSFWEMHDALYANGGQLRRPRTWTPWRSGWASMSSASAPS